MANTNLDLRCAVLRCAVAAVLCAMIQLGSPAVAAPPSASATQPPSVGPNRPILPSLVPASTATVPTPAAAPDSAGQPAPVATAAAPCDQAAVGNCAPLGCDGRVRSADQIWVISTRSLPCVSGAIVESPAFKVRRLVAPAAWADSTLDEFLATDDPGVSTCFVVHGNWIEAGEAVSSGLQAYRQLTRGLPADRPVRFVIWSWPSGRDDRHPLRDTRRKAIRTTSESIYLGSVIHRMQPTVPVSVIGFSFGARITSGALHLLGGGALGRFAIDGASAVDRPLNAVLVASGVDNYWLAAGQPHGQALAAADSMLLINNCCDSALKRYRLLERRDNQALGYTGLAGRSPYYHKARQIDACRYVGKTHDWSLYLNTRALTAAMQPYLWFQPAAVATSTPAVALKHPVK